MAEIVAKVLVVGGGPGGYVCAIRAGQLGLDVVLVEQGGTDGGLGGTCLNVGCIPSKALIHAADAYAPRGRAGEVGALRPRVERPTIDFARTVEWKDGIVGRLTSGVGALLKRHRVKILQGHATMVDGKTCRVETDTGSAGRARRACRAGDRLGAGGVAHAAVRRPRHLLDRGARRCRRFPERLAVVGAGYIGLELGTAFAKLGAKVTVIEAEDRILPRLRRRARPSGRPPPAGAGRRGPDACARRRPVRRGRRAAGRARGRGARSIPADRILVATGRRARIAGFGLERLDLTMNGAFVAIDERCATSMRNVWAVGDLTGEPMLAHRAMAQGVVVAEQIAGHRRVFDGAVIPAVCFTDPEIVTVGLSPDEARKAGHEVHAALFPFQANGRA